jgi:cytochrome c
MPLHRIVLNRTLIAWLLPLAAAAASAQTAANAADPAAARGQRLFLRCASCHDISGNGPAKNGPTLHGVIGRKAASVDGYGYSKSLAGQDFVWDEARLNTWLERPTAIAPGTTMAFEGMAAAADRLAVIAYLKTQR